MRNYILPQLHKQFQDDRFVSMFLKLALREESVLTFKRCLKDVVSARGGLDEDPELLAKLDGEEELGLESLKEILEAIGLELNFAGGAA